MMKHSFIVAVLALGLTVSGLHAAETGEGRGDPFRFSVDVAAEYTDNRDAWLDADKESTWDFLVKPRVDFFSTTERTMLDAYYAPGLRYRTNPSEAQNDLLVLHDLGLNLRYRSSPRLTLRLLEKFDYNDDPAIETSLEGGGIETLRLDRSYLMNGVEGGATVMLGKRTEGDLFGVYKLKRYDDDDAAILGDEDRTDLGATLKQQVGRNLWVGLRGVFSMYGYESVDLGGGTTLDRDFTSLFAGITLENRFAKQLWGGVRGGVQMLAYDDDAIDDETSPHGEIWLRGITTPAMRMRLTVSHGVRDADAFPYASQEYTGIGATVDWDAAARVRLSLKGAFNHGKYEDVLPGVAAEFGNGAEDTLDLSAQAAYHLSSSLTVKARQRYEEVDSDVRVSFQKNTTSIELSKSF